MKPAYLTVPSAITCLRVILAAVFAVAAVHGYWTAATVIMAAAGLTDFLDGFTARLLHQTTDFGKLFDPVADRLFLIIAATSVAGQGVLLRFVGLTLARELFQAALALYKTSKNYAMPKVTWVGKAGTCLQYFAFPVLLFELDHPSSMLSAVGVSLWICGWMASVMATVSYLGDYHQQYVNRRNRSTG